MEKKILFFMIIFMGLLTAGCTSTFEQQAMNKVSETIESITGGKIVLKQKTIDNLLETAESIDEENTKTVYKFLNDNYNQILSFKDEHTGASTYVVKYVSDTGYGNGGENFEYEIARFLKNSNNPNNSKCSYNYKEPDKFNKEAGNTEFFQCSEKEFLTNLPKIAEAKFEAFTALKQTIEEINAFENNCSFNEYTEQYTGDESFCNEQTASKYNKNLGQMEKQIELLQNTTL